MSSATLPGDAAWGRTPALERWASHVASAGMIATGVALHVMKDWLSPRDEFAVINHPLQPAMLHGHVLLAPLFMVAIGMLLRRHILPRALGSDSPRARRSGLGAALLLLPMIASGYLLQVITAERALLALKWTHVAASALFTVAYIVHVAVTLMSLLPPVSAGRVRM